MIVWYCSAILALHVMMLILAKPEERAAQLLGTAIYLPLLGRVMGWW